MRSHGTADLNNYDQFYGNLRNPIIRPNEHNLIPTDVPHRLLVRGTIGLPGQWDFAPVIEIRSGFPWSAVDEFQDFVGPRNRAGRLPRVRTLDFSLSRPWQVWKYRFRGGIKVYNIFGASAERDVQSNIDSPDLRPVLQSDRALDWIPDRIGTMSERIRRALTDRDGRFEGLLHGRAPFFHHPVHEVCEIVRQQIRNPDKAASHVAVGEDLD